jgi:CHAT domain-containing protein
MERIESLIDDWRAGIDNKAAPSELAEIGTRLKALIWEPISTQVAGARLVFVSPDGALGRFPMGALPGGRPETFLLEELALAVVPVPAMLPDWWASADEQPLGADTTRRRPALLVGDVDFDMTSSGANRPKPPVSTTRGHELASPIAFLLDVADHEATAGSTVEDRGTSNGGSPFRFLPLAGSIIEIDQIASLYRATHEAEPVELLGANATETAIRSSAVGSEVVHFATHGFFAPSGSLLRGVSSSSMAMRGSGAARIGTFHPGILSGVVLAGANRAADASNAVDDGILTASEVAVMDLLGTDLVVLSACSTGLGQTAGGEGLLGLQRAFQTAGARAVVSTLWQVNDSVTTELMQPFYSKLWKEKLPAMEALREAQLAILQQGREVLAADPKDRKGAQLASPKAWAAFVFSGSSR